MDNRQYRYRDNKPHHSPPAILGEARFLPPGSCSTATTGLVYWLILRQASALSPACFSHVLALPYCEGSNSPYRKRYFSRQQFWWSCQWVPVTYVDHDGKCIFSNPKKQDPKINRISAVQIVCTSASRVLSLRVGSLSVCIADKIVAPKLCPSVDVG